MFNVTPSFSPESFVFKFFRPQENSRPAFSNPSGLKRRISVDGRPDLGCINKKAFLNFSGIEWTIPCKFLESTSYILHLLIQFHANFILLKAI